MRRDHWNQVYRNKLPEAVSWYQPRPALSLELIAAAGIDRDSGIIDVGGGASTLVDCLLEQGYSSLAVLDLAGEGMAHSRVRLGQRAGSVQWFECDVASFQPPRHYGLWHDRAVFHFLTDPEDRRAYVRTLKRTLEPGGAVIIATFAPDGPQRCSGLEVLRHDEASIQRELGAGFLLQDAHREIHLTPGQAEQQFVYARFRWEPKDTTCA